MLFRDRDLIGQKCKTTYFTDPSTLIMHNFATWYKVTTARSRGGMDLTCCILQCACVWVLGWSFVVLVVVNL